MRKLHCNGKGKCCCPSCAGTFFLICGISLIGVWSAKFGIRSYSQIVLWNMDFLMFFREFSRRFVFWKLLVLHYSFVTIARRTIFNISLHTGIPLVWFWVEKEINRIFDFRVIRIRVGCGSSVCPNWIMTLIQVTTQNYGMFHMKFYLS